MNNEEFEAYLKRIDEQYRCHAQFEFFRLTTLNCFGRIKLKEILEEIENSGYKEGHDHGFDEGLGQEE